MKVLKHTKEKQMETAITSFDATELAHLIATKQLSPVEIMKSHIEVIEKINPVIATPKQRPPITPGKPTFKKLLYQILTKQYFLCLYQQ